MNNYIQIIRYKTTYYYFSKKALLCRNKSWIPYTKKQIKEKRRNKREKKTGKQGNR